MKIEIHNIEGLRIAEIISDEILVISADDGLDLLGNLYYQDFDGAIIHEYNITTDFFDLKNGLAGEILQKFSNYRFRLCVIGDFKKHKSKSVNDFIYESNKGRQINFVASKVEAVNNLAG